MQNNEHNRLLCCWCWALALQTRAEIFVIGVTRFVQKNMLPLCEVHESSLKVHFGDHFGDLMKIVALVLALAGLEVVQWERVAAMVDLKTCVHHRGAHMSQNDDCHQRHEAIYLFWQCKSHSFESLYHVRARDSCVYVSSFIWEFVCNISSFRLPSHAGSHGNFAFYLFCAIVRVWDCGLVCLCNC